MDLDATQFDDLEVPLVNNVTAREIRTGAEARQGLYEQVSKSRSLGRIDPISADPGSYARGGGRSRRGANGTVEGHHPAAFTASGSARRTISSTCTGLGWVRYSLR